MLKIQENDYRTLAHAVLFLVAALILLTFRDYGVTWDEELQSQYGLAVVDYYLSLFQDHRYQQIFNLYLYGGMFDGFASIFDRFTPFSLYETRHLLNASVGLVGLWGTWRLGRLLGGGAVGLLSLVMLVITPMYYGHMFNNPKDVPFATGIIWSIYYMGRCLRHNPQVPRPLIWKLGAILGLTLGVRIGGVMLLAFWWVVMGVDVLCAYRRENLEAAWKLSKNHFLKCALPVAVITYVVMLICWPWAQQNPIMNPLRALGEFSNFPQDVEVLLDGTTYRSTQLPWYYVPLYFGVQLPEFLLALLAVSLVVIPRIMRAMDKPKRQLLGLMVLMGGFPTTYAMLRHPALYDAVRHFLFVVPLACVVSALLFHYLCGWTTGQFHQRWSRVAVQCGLGLIVLIAASTQIYFMVRLHPYEYMYANRFAGGVAGAYGRYELDYWASSFKEAAKELQDFVAKEGGVPSGKIYKVAICGSWSSAMIYLPPDYEAVVANEPAEFFISTTRWMCQKMRPGKDIIEVSRLGAPLAIVKDLRGGYEHYEGNEKK